MKLPTAPNPSPTRRTRWASAAEVVGRLSGTPVRELPAGPSPVSRAGEPITIPYTVFKESAAKGNVVAIYSRGTSIEGRLKAPMTWPPRPRPRRKDPRETPPQPPRTSETFTTELPAFVDPGLEAFSIDHHVEISAVPIREGTRCRRCCSASGRRSC
jgi:hypothetical protein